MDVCCECYVLSGRGLCDELIIRPEEFYRLWCVVVCDQETSRKKWGGHGPCWAAAPQKLTNTIYWTQNVFWFSLKLLSEIFLILIKIQRDIVIHVHTSSCNVPVIIVIFSRPWIFGTVFRIIFSYQISWKSVQWEPSCSMRTAGQTDTTKYLFAFRDFANAPVWFIINVSDIFKFLLFLPTLPTFFWFYLSLDIIYFFIF